MAGWQVQFHTVADSTNDLARAAPVGTAVVAAQQRCGRGRLGRRWIAPPGGLWLSAVFPPPPPAQAAAARAVAHAVTELVKLPVRFCPPNDLVVGGKKLGGVLVEAVWYGGRPQRAVVGVGINVNNPAGQLPPPLDQTAVALVDVLGLPQSLPALLAGVLAGLAGMVGKER
ncbi:MAG: biotin--[acetyl-CoA-carboxylase] ligase [Candidatus Bipolaricaulaceae bacterium]